jgi:LysR family transcriptional activator of dmlA
MLDNIGDLRIFTRIVAGGSLSAASREMNLSLATISKRLGTLEEQLGVRLINRTTRRLYITPEGVEFCKRCLRILAELDEATRVASSGSTSIHGMLRVSATFNFGRRYVAPALFRFQRLHPQLKVDLHLDDSMVNIVESGIDVGIRIGKLEDSSLIARKLVDTRRILVGAPSYLEARGTPSHPSELVGHDCFMPSRLDRSWTFRRGDEVITVPTCGQLHCNVGDTLLAWTIDGGGLMMRSVWDVMADIRSGRLRHVLVDWDLSEAPIFAVYPSKHNLSAKVRGFVDFLAQSLHEASDAEAFGWR